LKDTIELERNAFNLINKDYDNENIKLKNKIDELNIKLNEL
jgi:DNA-binding XRE family transcriptional regulator